MLFSYGSLLMIRIVGLTLCSILIFWWAARATDAEPAASRDSSLTYGKGIAIFSSEHGEYRVHRSEDFGSCLEKNGRLMACDEDEAMHSEALVHPAMLMHPFPRKLLVLGNPEGTIVREMLKYFTIKSIDWVDEASHMVDHPTFKLQLPAFCFDDVLDRVTRYQMSVSNFVKHSHTPQKYDAIIADRNLDMSVMQAVQQHWLDQGGVLAVAAGVIHYSQPDDLDMLVHLSELFHQVYSYAQYRPSFGQMFLYHIATQSEALMSPAEMHPSFVDDWLERRAQGLTSHYDSATHASFFSGLPMWIRDQMKTALQVVSRPPFVSTVAPHVHIAPKSLPAVQVTGIAVQREFFGCTEADATDLPDYIEEALKTAHIDVSSNLIISKAYMVNATTAQGNGSLPVMVYSFFQDFPGGQLMGTLIPSQAYLHVSINSFDPAVLPDEIFGALLGSLEAQKNIGSEYVLGGHPSQTSAHEPFASGQLTHFQYADGYFINPKVQAKKSPTAGNGQFALHDIAKGEIIFQGPIEPSLRTEEEITASPEWRKTFLRHMSEQAEDGIYVSPLLGDLDASFYTNHNCDPNLWYEDTYDMMVARRDIKKGEELTYDYATVDSDPDSAFACQCGSPICRRTVRGSDWKLQELQDRYGLKHFYPHIRKLIVKSHRS